jgi:50S ribosomal subunit-associated GTPase HflX
MPRAIKVLEVENPHFTIRLYEDLLKIDLKGSFKNEIEEALENKPVLKETIGRILGIFVPLHIRVSEIDSVHMDETGKITVSLPHHRNIVIPLERKENAEKLVEKLDQLIPSSYSTVPYYFPTEQADIVDKLKRNRKKQKK